MLSVLLLSCCCVCCEEPPENDPVDNQALQDAEVARLYAKHYESESDGAWDGANIHKAAAVEAREYTVRQVYDSTLVAAADIVMSVAGITMFAADAADGWGDHHMGIGDAAWDDDDYPAATAAYVTARGFHTQSRDRYQTAAGDYETAWQDFMDAVIHHIDPNEPEGEGDELP